MVAMSVAYQGQLRCVAEHSPSGSRIETDAPVDNHGKGERFSPSDLLGAAAGSCMLTIMGIQAERHGWNIDGARVEVEKEMASDTPRRIGRLVIRATLPASLEPEVRQRLERAALTCPVLKSLSSDVAIDHQFDVA